jgi:hypothetical protein
MKIGLLGLLVAIAHTFADSSAVAELALDFSGGEQANSIDDDMAGWRFRTYAPISVDSLGLYDSDLDGLYNAHQVGIWSDAGALITSATIQAGIDSPLDGKFRFEPVTPVTLPANETYRIAALYWPTFDTVVTAFATVTTAPEIRYLDRAYLLGATSFQFPTNFNSIDLGANFGPTFKFTTLVPEPSTSALVVIGSLAALLRRRRFGAVA